MKSLASLLLIIGLTVPAVAQRYNTAIGARIDRRMLGITVKQRVFKTVTVEGILAGNSEAMIGTLLLEKHYPIIGRGLNAYMGGGAHLGGANTGGVILGPDLLLGVEFKLPFMPLTVAGDLKPSYHFRTVSNEQTDISRIDFSTALSVRYVIGKETREDRQRYRERRRTRRDRDKAKTSKVKEREKAKRAKIKDKAKEKRQKEKENTRKLRDKQSDKTPVGEWKVFKPFKRFGRKVKEVFEKDD
ncbi:MAG: hypothetical protein WA958_01060 [Tunicatimonas sp.]